MKLKYDLARTLRKRMTSAEWLLWQRIRLRQPGGPIFRRQYAFGPYILDFYCIKARLAVEMDGQIHDRDVQARRDQVRDRFLEEAGVRVYRIRGADMFRFPDQVADGLWDLAVERLRDKAEG